MIGSVVSRRYARALFTLGKSGKKGTLEKVGENLAAMADLVKESPELARLFRDPAFTPEEKRGVISALSKKLGVNKVTRNFCFLLADNDRLVNIERINAEFQAMLNTHNNVLQGEVVTAIPLANEKREKMLAQLEKKAGYTLALDFTVDETLLGGMVLKVGDKVMDASLRTQLSLLKDTIKRGD